MYSMSSIKRNVLLIVPTTFISSIEIGKNPELCNYLRTHVRNRVDNFAGSNPPGSYLFLKLWNDLQNTLEVRGVEKVLCMSLPQVPEGARLF